MRRFWLQINILFLCSFSILGQNSKYGKVLHSQQEPQYTQFKKNYALSQITYYEKRIVLDITLSFTRGTKYWTKSVAFMPPDNVNAWCLKDPKTQQVFKLLEIRNIKRNGNDLKARVKNSKEKVSIEMEIQGPDIETFSCEAHFAALPKDVEMVDLLEGPNSKFLEGHWNFFDIKVQRFDKKNQPLPEKNTEKPTPISSLKELPPAELGFVPTAKKSAPTKKTAQHPSLSSIRDIDCNKMLELSKLTFQDNSVKFLDQVEAERLLFILKNYLQQNSSHKIELFGHSDVFGDTDRNLLLAQQRVERLQQWFTQQNISSDRILTQALGDTDPIYPDGNPRNRRVEVKIICPNK